MFHDRPAAVPNSSPHLSGPSVCAQAPSTSCADACVRSQPTGADRLCNGSHSSVAATGLPSPAVERRVAPSTVRPSHLNCCSNLKEHVTQWRLHLSRRAIASRHMGHHHSSTGPKSCNYESACIVEVLFSPSEAARRLSRILLHLCTHTCAALAPLRAKQVAASNPAVASPGDPGSIYLVFPRSASLQLFSLDGPNACSFTASPTT